MANATPATVVGPAPVSTAPPPEPVTCTAQVPGPSAAAARRGLANIRLVQYAAGDGGPLLSLLDARPACVLVVWVDAEKRLGGVLRLKEWCPPAANHAGLVALPFFCGWRGAFGRLGPAPGTRMSDSFRSYRSSLYVMVDRASVPFGLVLCVLLRWSVCPSCRWLAADCCFPPTCDPLSSPFVQASQDGDLSEPYSIFTYRYFLTQWPQLCFLVRGLDSPPGCWLRPVRPPLLSRAWASFVTLAHC